MQEKFARTTEQPKMAVMALDIARGAVPLFRRIADTLTDAIGRGDYPVGGQLPTEFTLMRMFGASRFTIREALGELRAGGLVSSRRGSGSVVLRATMREPVFSESYRSIDSFLAGVVEAPTRTRSVTDVVADAALAAELHCEEGRQFLLARGLRRHRDQPDAPPLALVLAYVSAVYGVIRPHLLTLSESIATTMEKLLSVRVQRIVQELEPVLLDAESADALAAPVGGPAMLVMRWYYLESGALLLASRSIYPRGRQVYHTELQRTEPTEESADRAFSPPA
jgi:GntR family transcriptional regulator